MGKKAELGGVVDKLNHDLNVLYKNTRQLEGKVTEKVETIGTQIANNSTEVQLLAKDVKDSIQDMAQFMQIFEKHDEKEMEKYDSINEGLRDLDKKVDEYMVKTDQHTKDMKWVKEVADKGKTYMIRGAQTVTVVTAAIGVITVVHPLLKDYYVEAGKSSRIEYTETQKAAYYKKKYEDTKAAIDRRKAKDNDE